MRLANQDWDLSLMEEITGYYSFDFVKMSIGFFISFN